MKKKLADSSGVDSSQAEKDDPFIRYRQLDAAFQFSDIYNIINVCVIATGEKRVR